MRSKLSDLTNSQNEEADNSSEAYEKAAVCTKLAGRGVIRVIGRCNEAQENKNLGVTRVIERCENAIESEDLNLSECQLMQVPDAIFHLMRNTNLKTCDLSSNVITKIPPKLCINFSLITQLNISNNRMSKLPNELSALLSLIKLDFSYNCFAYVPGVAYSLPKLEILNGEKNFIEDVEIERLKRAATTSLKSLNLKENPLNERTRQALNSDSIKAILEISL